ncbi:AsmA family protein [Halioglobus maricola]|uniref:AsmA family protein n=1 Tax=Halioglobus maricola TaxID=2601894 RepID=A0A5P9NJQ4_9GAMM|nr:AsmA-like C-terminal region-containing protein [Halioglobus maricola]QFU76113.1 AsmA family protein [Halioglobus maricola]
MRKLLIAVLLLLVLLALPLLAMRSERTLIAFSHWAVETFTEYRLNLVKPVLRPLERKVSAEEIHLYPKDDAAPPFLSVLGFAGDIGWRDLYRANLEATTLSARQVILYTSDSDDVDDPRPREWLNYLGWLPADLSVGQFHLVTAGENIFIFPLEDIQGGRPDSHSFQASGQARYEGEPLELDIAISTLRDHGRISSVDLHGKFTAPASNSFVRLNGEVRGSRDEFSYDFKLNADYADIREFLRGFRARGVLEGRLKLEAEMNGDTNGFVLNNALFTLDNMPAYGVEAAGTMEYDIQAGGELKLVAAGEISSMDVVLEWLNLDLHSLGRAAGNATITGTLKQPVIDEFLLRSEADNGLIVSVGGHLDPQRMGARDNEIRLDMTGPSVATLAQWTGPLPFEPGAFSASGSLVGREDRIALENLVIEVGDPDELLFRLAGEAGNLVGMDTKGIAAAQDVTLTMSVDSPDSRYLGEIMGTDVPGGFVLDGDLTLAGSGELLQPVTGLFTARGSDLDIIIVPHEAAITPLKQPIISGTEASVAITLSDVSAFSQYTTIAVPALGRVDGKAKFQQHDQRLALNDLQLSVDGPNLQLWAKGAVNNLAPFNGLTLQGNFSDVPTDQILQTIFENFSHPTHMGALAGQFRLNYQDDVLDLPAIAITTRKAQGPLRLDIAGKASDITGALSARASIDYQLRDTALLETLTELRLNPLHGQAELTYSPSEITANHRGKIGESSIDLDTRISHAKGTITGIQAKLASPVLYLDDIGLQASVASTEDYNPSEQLVEAEPVELLENVLGTGSSLPTDFRINIGGVVGERTNIDNINIHITGVDNRYTLREFNVGYADTVGEVRGIIDLNARPPFVSLAGEAIAIPLNTLGRDLGRDADIRGELTVRGGISSQGANREELLSDLDGSLALALENAEIQGAAYDLLATDLLAWFYSGAAAEKSTHIDCTMAKFQLLDGVANSDSLYVETKRMVATGEAEVDMVGQRMDLKITPRSKSRALQVPSSVRLRGDFDNLKTTVSPIAAAFDAYAEVLSLVPRMTRKLFGIKRDDKALRPCEAVQ